RSPDVCLVDFKTKRQEDPELREALQRIGSVVMRVTNPAGTITPDAWRVVSEAFKSKERVRVEVRGEEDLLALVCIALAPSSAAVYKAKEEALAVERKHILVRNKLIEPEVKKQAAPKPEKPAPAPRAAKPAAPKPEAPKPEGKPEPKAEKPPTKEESKPAPKEEKKAPPKEEKKPAEKKEEKKDGKKADPKKKGGKGWQMGR